MSRRSKKKASSAGAPPPPVPEQRRSVYDYYGLVFDRDGCPMKKTAQGMVFHPILPAYLIADYVSLFEKTRDPSFLDHGRAMARHALKRAHRLGEALVFRYDPGIGLSNVPHTFYSALTQAWYVKALCLLDRHCPGSYDAEIRRFFSSLTVPVNGGGVLMEKKYGWIVEEYPHRPAFYTLNGWLTVLRWIVQCRETLQRLDIDYARFLERNLDAVEHLLPLYDAGFCLNSRYQLTGFTRIRIVLSKPVPYRCAGFGVDIPGEGMFAGELERTTTSRWGNYLERTETRLLQFNVLLSLISMPVANVFRATITVDAACKAKILVAQGAYRPDASGMPTEAWKELAEIPLEPEITHQLQCPVPFDGDDLFAYPTNFKKNIGGTLYNGYHFVHIVDLAELYAFSGREKLRAHAEQWLGYTNGWGELPGLAEGYSLTSHIYGDQLGDVVARMFAVTGTGGA